jgi:hypothetical protein
VAVSGRQDVRSDEQTPIDDEGFEWVSKRKRRKGRVEVGGGWWWQIAQRAQDDQWPRPSPGLAIAAVLVLIATLRLSYGYYVFLRWVVCATCIYGAGAAAQEDHAWAWILTAVALLFNPIVPVRMRREEWFVFDVLAAGVLLAGGVALRKPRNSGEVTAGGNDSAEDVVTCIRCGARNRVIRALLKSATCGRCQQSQA